jgi:predicted nucleotidyltransferase
MAPKLIEALRAEASALAMAPEAGAEAGMAGVVVVGSLARGDLVEGGSDVDLMFIHRHGELSASEVAARPHVREMVKRFGDPVLSLCKDTGRQKPFMVDLHFVDREVLRQQPDWAHPGRFRLPYTARNAYLWLYAFDLAAHRICLWGEDPLDHVEAHPPRAYAAWAAVESQTKLAEVRQHTRLAPEVTEDLVGRWKVLAGGVLRLAALTWGGRSLRKAEVLDDFRRLTPPFADKGFANVLWEEYLFGRRDLGEDRRVWLARCEAFCSTVLELVTWSTGSPPG